MKNLTYLFLFTLIFSCTTPDKIIEKQPKWFDIEIVDTFEDEVGARVTVRTEMFTLIETTATPSTLVGNAEQELIIVGSGFGTEKGRVYIGNYIADSGQIIQWTDTHIICQVPITNSGSYGVTIKTKDGLTTLATANNISVKWGVYTATGYLDNGEWKRFPIVHVDLNGQGGKTFHCPIGTPETTRQIFKDALLYWSNKKGVNWILGENKDRPISDNDDGIHMLGIEEGAGLARASVRATNCGDNSFYISDSYAGFDSAPSLNVAKHETGHALGLGHDESGVMCATTSCATSEASADSLEGATYMVDKSVNEGCSCKPLMIKSTTQPTLTSWYIDNDNDGYGNPNISVQSSGEPLGYVSNNKDCNDSNANINPLATEVPCNNIDENCDGKKLRPKCRN